MISYCTVYVRSYQGEEYERRIHGHTWVRRSMIGRRIPTSSYLGEEEYDR